LGFVDRLGHFSCRAVPNLSVTIRNYQAGRLVLYGESSRFGAADHALAAELVRRVYPFWAVEAVLSENNCVEPSADVEPSSV
jgi:hypothetical protein